MARTFTQKHYEAIAVVINKASRDLNLTVELDVICKVMDTFAETFKWESSKFDEEEFKRACRGR